MPDPLSRRNNFVSTPLYGLSIHMRDAPAVMLLSIRSAIAVSKEYPIALKLSTIDAGLGSTISKSSNASINDY